MISGIISQDILKYLVKKGFSIKNISTNFSIPENEIKLILKGKGVLSPNEIKLISKILNLKIIHILSEACDTSHLTGKLKKNVEFYKEIKKYKKKKKD